MKKWGLALTLLVFCLPLPGFGETYEWEDYTRPYTEEIGLSAPAEVRVSLPGDWLSSRTEIRLAVDVMLTSGYGAVYVSVNDASGERRPVSSGESGEVILTIPAVVFAPGANSLYFFDEKGFAGNIIRRLEFRPPEGDRKEAVPVGGGPSPDETLPAVPEERKSRIGVIQFDALNTESADKSLGPMASEMFTTELVKLNVFRMIEREQLNKVLAELSLAQTGVLESGDVQRIGKILDIDAMVTGSVARIGDKLRIDARFIDVGSGVIVTAESRVLPFDLHAMADGVGEMALAMTRAYYGKARGISEQR